MRGLMKTFLHAHRIFYAANMKRLLLLLLTLSFFSLKTTALNYYWIGGTGNWSNLNHWATTSGGAVLHTQMPTAVDDVFFDANSFTAAGQTVTLDPATVLVRNLNWTGVTNTPTMAGAASTVLNVYGSLTFVPGMTMNFTGDVNFEATAAGQTIRSGGKSFKKDVNFNGVGGGWTFQDAVTVVNRISLNNGIVTTNDQTVAAYEVYSATFSSRTLNMGSSVFNISGVANAWNLSGAGMSLNCGTSVINCSGSGASFYGNGFVYYDLNFAAKAYIAQSNSIHNTSFMGDGEFQSNNVFNNLTLSPGHEYIFKSGCTQTINGTFNANGTCSALINLHSDIPSLLTTINHPGGPVVTSYLILQDMVALGPTNFDANHSIDFGNNTSWLITMDISKNYYWIGNGGNWNDGSHWSSTSGGPASGCAPTSLDNAIFDANSFSSPGQTVTINIPTAYCKDMRWTGVMNAPSLAGPASSILKIHGSLTFVTGMNLTFTGDVRFESNFPTETIASAGRIFNRNVAFNGVVGGWTLQDAFTVANRISLNAGTFTSNNQTVTCYEFYATTNFPPKVLNMGSSIFNISGDYACFNTAGLLMTANSGTSTINCSGDAADFRGSGGVWYDVNFTNPLASVTCIAHATFHDVVFAGNAFIWQVNNFHNVICNKDVIFQANNTYNDLALAPGHSYELWAATTQTINGTLNANSSCTGGLIDIHSNTPGVQASISHPPGAVSTSYLKLKDIAAIGGGNFTANNSIDLGNNSGWTFNGAPGGSITPTLSIAASPAGPVCSGAPVAFTATATTNGTGTITYDFKVNSISIQSGLSNSYVTTSLLNGDVVTCDISISGGSCYLSTTAASNAISMVVNPSITPSVSLVSSPWPHCSGSTVSFTATAFNIGGGTVSYNFKVNGFSVQNGASNVYSSSTLSPISVVSCDITITGASSCLTSNTVSSNNVSITLLPTSAASISISASSTTICPGAPVTFTATAINGAGIPSSAAYQWKLNGVNVGTNLTSFTSNALNNGDVVTCTLTSTAPCILNPVSVSNSIQIIVNSAPPPSLAIITSNNNICVNTPVTFTATALNTGTTPSFQWQLNGVNVGTNSSTYSNNNLANGDQVNCIMNTVTPCSLSSIFLSNTITMAVNAKPVVSFHPSNPTIIIGDAIQLNASAPGNISSYLWTPSPTLSNTGIANPIANPINNTTYYLRVTAGGTCSTDTSITVKVLKGIYIPNAFLPAGVNKIFRIPPGTAIKDLQYFSIYNRYGNLVFISNDINAGWDGTWKGKACDQGTYTYIIKARDHNGELVLKGTVMLIR